MLSVAEAQARITAGFRRLDAENVPLDQAFGRILAGDVAARVTNPPDDVSAMDGYAVQFSGLQSFRVVGESAAGHGFSGTVEAGSAVRIFTGAPVPAGADSIIIQENVTREGDVIRLRDGNVVQPGKHIRRAGLDFRSGDVLLPAGRRLRARDLALAAAMNVPCLACTRQPRIGLLATGDELVTPGDTPASHQIISSSPTGLAAEIRSWGGVAVPLGIAKDRVEDIRGRLTDAASLDTIITIGGASVGDHDLFQAALAPELKVDFWKIAMRPGKPLIFGSYRGVPMLGLPGNPVSAFVCSLLFLKPAIQAMTGSTEPVHVFLDVPLAAPLGPNDTRQDFCRATLETGEAGQLMVRPLPVQDSGMLRFLATAQALIVRPPNDPARLAGDLVRILRLD